MAHASALGRLTPAPGSPFQAQGLGPFGSEFRPTNPSQLFVSNAHNTAADSGTVSAFTDSSRGTLTPVAGSPFADDQMAPCWVEISHDGRFLFTVNTASGTISRLPAEHDIVYYKKSQEIGLVSAAMWSPMAKRNIAIASLARPYGDTVVEDLWVEIYAMRELQYQKLMKRAKVVARPFIKLDRRTANPPADF